MNKHNNQISDASQASGTQPSLPGFTARFLAMGALVVAGAAQAALINPQEAMGNFGTVNQANVFGPGIGANGGNSCAPTATMNSFTFLQNTYPAVYGNMLMGGNATWTAAAIQLALGMGTTSAAGTSLNGWVNGKVNYINANAPGTTVFAGMSSAGVVAGQPWLAAGAPTPAFLNQQLSAGEDIEIGIQPIGGGVGHVLTLTGMSWNNIAGGMVYGGTDTLTLNSIDPANPGVNTALTFTAGTLTINGGAYNNYQLTVALAESPVPETSTTIAGGLALGLVFLVVLRKNQSATNPTA